MRGRNEFWLTYHHVLEAYKAEGATVETRCENIAEQFRGLPPSVKRHILEDIDEFLTVMAELKVAIRAEMDGAIRHPK